MAMLKTYLSNITFDRPYMLWLLLLVPLIVALAWWRSNRQTAALLHPSTSHLKGFKNLRITLRNLPLLLRGVVMALVIIAMARPAKYENIPLTEGNGIDIVLCLDISGSMLARDFQPDRLRASIEVAKNFVGRRRGDRIGLVAFSGQSLSLCPLTTDHKAVAYQLDRLAYGQLADGTSLGTGLASAVDRLSSSTAPSRIVILLTDGEDTGGFFDPATAIGLAESYGVLVYTIGVGTIGYAPMPYRTSNGTELRQEKVSIDEKLLKEIADRTGGNYFRATSRAGLDSIYTVIDQLERSKVKTSIFVKRTDEYFPLIALALILLTLDVLLSATVFRKLP